MKIVLVGAPDSGKFNVSDKLAAYFDEKKNPESIWAACEIDIDMGDEDGGFLYDYREELRLAVTRATSASDTATVSHHSLIDSNSYTVVRLLDLVNQDPTNSREIERWFNVLGIVSIMLEDGYKADHTLYLPYLGSDSNYSDLDKALFATLKEYEIPYREIDPLGEVETWITD